MTAMPATATPPALRARWRDVVQPKEHGSWSLALEPVALGLLVAPSVAGGWLAVATLAGFFARRPLKIAVREPRPERRGAARVALAVALVVATAAFAAAWRTGAAGWWRWLLPSATGGGIFLWCDLQNDGRSEVAEIAGAAAFAGVTGAIAAAAGWTPWATLALAFAMAGRAVPTVMAVRAGVRGGKTGEFHAGPALIAAALAVAGAVGFWRHGLAPFALVTALTLLLARTAIYLLVPHRSLRPRTLGFIELTLGLGYVAFVAVAWRSPIA